MQQRALRSSHIALSSLVVTSFLAGCGTTFNTEGTSTSGQTLRLTYAREGASTAEELDYPLGTINCLDSLSGLGGVDSRTSAPGASYFVAVIKEGENGARYDTSIYLDENLVITSDAPFDFFGETMTFEDTPGQLVSIADGQGEVVGVSTISGIVRCDSFDTTGGGS